MDGVRDFWQKKEESLGTPILSRSLAQVTYGLGLDYPVWGLLYCTKNTLYFEYQRKESWMFTTGPRNSGPLFFECLLGPSLELTGAPPRGWRRWFSSKAQNTYSLKTHDASTPLLQFLLEQNDSDLHQVLSRLLSIEI